MSSWYDVRLSDDDQFPNWVKYQADAKRNTEEIYALLKSLNPGYKPPELTPWTEEQVRRLRAYIEARAKRGPGTIEEVRRHAEASRRYWHFARGRD